MKTGRFIGCLILTFIFNGSYGQDLLSLLEEDTPKKEFVTNAFKSTRIINSHSTEQLHRGVLDVRILHRFGPVNSGVNNLFGLDQANIRLGLDYGVTDRIMIGIGRSNVNKELDGFIKYRMLWQSTGKGGVPFSMTLVAGSTLNSTPFDETRVNFFTSRLAYYGQLLIARKFSENFTLQLTPGVVHINLVTNASDANDIYSVGFGGRYKFSKRLAINWDYHYVLPGMLPAGYYNYAGLGFDIETGGHVFQLHATNSVGMNERAFIARNSGNISKFDIRFGFNISRVFTVSKRYRGVP
jgi:hypothetical protein